MKASQQARTNPVQQQVGGYSNYFHGASPDLLPELLQQTFADIWSPRAALEVPLFWYVYYAFLGLNAMVAYSPNLTYPIPLSTFFISIIELKAHPQVWRHYSG